MEANVQIPEPQGLLDSNTNVILVQFHTGSNLDALSPEVRKTLSMNEVSTTVKPVTTSGVQFIELTKQVAIHDFCSELEEAGYCLIDAYYQKRPSSDSEYFHYIVRFVFCRTELATIDKKDKPHIDAYHGVLDTLCTEALWAVRGFCNPYLQEGTLVAGEYALSINLSTRAPFVNGDGKAILERPVGANGKRNKNATPQRIKPMYRLVAKESVSLTSPIG